MRASSFAVTMLAGLVAFSTGARAAAVVDSDQVSKILSDAKMVAFQLREDADQMESFTRSSTSWISHSEAIEKIKENVNAMGRLLAKLQEKRSGAAPWEQTAIDRMTPMAKELAANTTAAIEHLRKNPERLNTPAYQDYLEAIVDSAHNLATMIGGFVDYGKTQQRLERLSTKLEVPATR
jgi:hypothetical protein